MNLNFTSNGIWTELEGPSLAVDLRSSGLQRAANIGVYPLPVVPISL
jgi:hypothetical protein